MSNRPDVPLVPTQDAIIGRAFWWSVVAVVCAGVVFGALWWILGSRGPQPAVVVAVVAPAEPPPPALPPAALFRDVTRQAGVAFVHVNGARGEVLLPETMGSGCAFFDYDGDLDPDLLLINATHWSAAPDPGPPPTPVLYRNDGSGHFEDVTAAAGLEVSLYGAGTAVADYDGDGDVDVFISALGTNRLFRNDGGRFVDVTTPAGVAGDLDAWSTAAAFLDIDNDGDLDLFVGNYVKWSRAIDFAVDFRLVGLGRAYGAPTHFEGTHSYLYRNHGDGTFRDISESAGIQIVNPASGGPVGKALALGIADIDRDGRIDILVANDTVRNFLFHNQGGGIFEEIGTRCGVAYDRMGNATGAMGVDVADYGNDGALGIAIGNFANEMSSLFVAEAGSPQFADLAIIEGLGAPSRKSLTFGVLFLDYDLDGRLDFLQCNGHLEERINQVQPSQHYQQAAQLFWNAGPTAATRFVEVPRERSGDLARPIVGRGSATADIDGDGDLDLLLTQVAGPVLLLRNEQDTGHHWLQVKLIGSGGNQDAIGAWVELQAAGQILRRQVMATRSYLSQSELPVSFGLGGHDAIEALQVIWPDGGRQTIEPPAVDQRIVVRREPNP